jgi:hypothetical protein
MATIENHTGAPHFWFEQTGPEGERLDVLIVRATFDFAADGKPMTLAREQQPIAFGDTFAGPVASEPLRAVVEEDGDLLPYKPGTDILVMGNAHAPDDRAHENWIAGIRVGNIQKILRLHGPRQFHKRLLGWRLGPTELVTFVPLDIDLPSADVSIFPARSPLMESRKASNMPETPPVAAGSLSEMPIASSAEKPENTSLNGSADRR